MMRYFYMTLIAALLISTNTWATPMSLPITFTAGTPAKAADVNSDFSAVKTAVNANDAQIYTNTNTISANTTAIQNKKITPTVLNATCSATALASVPNGSFLKVGDITATGGTTSFNKVSATSTVEVTFNGRLYAATIAGQAVSFELTVDNVAPTNGPARALVFTAEAGGNGVPATITGIFTGLAAGLHTVNIYASGVGGTATNAMINPGCIDSNHVVIKEFD